jgi:hypothetical protein
MTSPRASNSVVAAAIVSILLGSIGAIFNLAALVLYSFNTILPGNLYPPFLRPALFAIWFLCFLAFAFIVLVGIQIIRLRNWARIAILVTAGCLLFFSLVGIAVIFAVLYFVPSPDPMISKSLLATVLAFVYGVPFAIALWWLVLFTRPSVIAQFHSAGALQPSLAPANTFQFTHPACPVPIRVVGWYLASFVLVLPLLPFLSSRIPAFFFGRILYGTPALLVYAANFLLLTIAGFGLLQLKRWSFPLAIISQLVACLNGLSAILSPHYDEIMQAILLKMNLPNLNPNVLPMLHFYRYFNLLGLTIPVAIIITLLISRQLFFSLASCASIPPHSSPE